MLSTFQVSCRRAPPVRLCYGAVRHIARDTRTTKKDVTDSASDNMDMFMRMVESGKLGFDPWSQYSPLLDLHVPTPWSTLRKQTSFRESLKFMQTGAENKISNAVALFQIAKKNSLPWNPTVSPWSLQIFRSSSTKPGTWLEPLREIAGASYERINKALATNDVEQVQALTSGDYQKQLIAKLKALHPPVKKAKKAPMGLKLTWRLHSLASPIKCVSIRATEGNLAKHDPLIGTRLVVQACLRFDTWQSLAVTSSSKPEPKRVLEYLVFEKKMWYDGPWLARNQLWEGVLSETSSPL